MMGRKLSAWILLGVFAALGCGGGSDDGGNAGVAGAGGDDGGGDPPDEPELPEGEGGAANDELGGYQEPPPGNETPPSSQQTPPSSYEPPGSGAAPPDAPGVGLEPQPCTPGSDCEGCNDECFECICSFSADLCVEVCGFES
jgi:hypothetical protein